MGYKKCPRCELNYIPDTEEYCDICKAELKLAPPIYDDTYDDDSILCPICKQNYIIADEEMCFQCAEKYKDDQQPIFEEPSVLDEEEDEGWRAFLDDEKETIPGEEGIVSLEEIGEDEEEEEEEEEEVYDGKPVDEDDFDDDFVDDDLEDDEDEDEVDDDDLEDDEK